ncbi:unnamed protein product [Gongylonema pulchrum]|uniref:C2H2-type domain-containing protein n=1 Tax=Gongylonema pulchrum TaxID=637853 RepID=A0A183CUB2_9BILA|nr:unnamed protein product [Gongylonema pulchrum]
MKEVHKYKRTPTDIIELDPYLKEEFSRTVSRCFPDHFSEHMPLCRVFRKPSLSRSVSLKSQTESKLCIPSATYCSFEAVRSAVSPLFTFAPTFVLPYSPTLSSPSATVPVNLSIGRPTSASSGAPLLPKTDIPLNTGASHLWNVKSHLNWPVSVPGEKPTAVQCIERSPSSRCSTLTSLLAAAPKNNPPQARVQPIIHSQNSRRTCRFCQEIFEGDYLVLYRHVKQHLCVLPYECSICKRADVDRQTIQEHISQDHDVKTALIDRMTEPVSRQCCALFTACFPDVPLQPLLHDSVQQVSGN